MAQRGAIQILWDILERIYDPECLVHIEGDVDMIPLILDTAMYELFSVAGFALGIAGSMLTAGAVKSTIEPTDIFSFWMAFIICVVVSTITVTFTARATARAKKKLKKLKKDVEMEMEMEDDDADADDDAYADADGGAD